VRATRVCSALCPTRPLQPVVSSLSVKAHVKEGGASVGASALFIRMFLGQHAGDLATRPHGLRITLGHNTSAIIQAIVFEHVARRIGCPQNER
jgi:hypothetical protein